MFSACFQPAQNRNFPCEKGKCPSCERVPHPFSDLRFVANCPSGRSPQVRTTLHIVRAPRLNFAYFEPELFCIMTLLVRCCSHVITFQNDRCLVSIHPLQIHVSTCSKFLMSHGLNLFMPGCPLSRRALECLALSCRVTLTIKSHLRHVTYTLLR